MVVKIASNTVRRSLRCQVYVSRLVSVRCQVCVRYQMSESTKVNRCGICSRSLIELNVAQSHCSNAHRPAHVSAAVTVRLMVAVQLPVW